jgi:peptidoglycan hydrolase-like protein with peptidoglycan-binding domain
VSRSGWFRKRQSLPETSGTSATKRIWQRALVPATTKKRAIAITAASAAVVMVSGVSVVAFASPGSHASTVSLASSAKDLNTAKGSNDFRTGLAAASLQVVSVSPRSGAKYVNGTSPIRVQFSSPLAANSPLPTLSPKIAGSWSIQGNSAVFTPAVGYYEDTKVTVKIPGGLAGVVSAAGNDVGNGGTLAATQTQSFTTGWFSTMRLQQLLTQLGYLPMTWTSKSHTTISRTNAHAELVAAYEAPSGTFSWKSGYPSTLKNQWKAGSYNVLQDGAVRAFESVHGLTMDGDAGRTVWTSLLSAVAKNKTNPNGYTYALATQVLPEHITIWHNGKVVETSPANTGIPAAPTQDGTFPVYLKYVFSYMKGMNPDGTKYDDPVWYASYFNGGDAVHEFSRYSYGFNQSLGCVELPFDAAKQAYPYLTYGSLVTVTGPVGA